MIVMDIPNVPNLNLQSVTNARSIVADGYVDCGTTLFPAPPTFQGPGTMLSVELWMMLGEQVGSFDKSKTYTICSMGEMNISGWSLVYEASTMRLWLRNHITPELSVFWSIPGGLSQFSWYHIVVVFTGQSVLAYLNGKSIGSTTPRGIQYQPPGKPPLLLGATAPAGGLKTYATYPELEIRTGDNWSGDIKLCRMWNITVDQTMVTQLYNLAYEVDDLTALYGYVHHLKGLVTALMASFC